MPLKPLFDLHTHTVASGHAYGTLQENLRAAREQGLLALGTSDHSPGMPGGTDRTFFENYRILPREVFGVRLLRGMEANITDYDGSIDGGTVTEEMDYVIASLHSHCIRPGSEEENTRAVIGAMKHPCVKIIGHPDDGRYPLDLDRVAEAARDFGVALEINNSSLRPSCRRLNGASLVRRLARTIAEKGALAVMGSDAHIWCDVGRFAEAEAVLEETDFPEAQLLNFRMEGLDFLLRKREK